MPRRCVALHNTMKKTILCLVATAALAAGAPPTTTPISEYWDTAFGWREAPLPETHVPASLHHGMPAKHQISRRYMGVPTTAHLVRQTRRDDAAAHASRRFFPASPQRFMPYLDGIFVPGNTCAEPCEWVGKDALSTSAQWVKHRLSRIGLQYDLTLSYNYTGILPRPNRNRSDFSSFNNCLTGKWFLYRNPRGSHGLFLSYEADWGIGTNFNERRRSAQSSIGSLSNPQGSLRGGKGVFLPELALGWSGLNGRWVMMAGTLDTSNYLDQNAYTGSWAGGLMNQSFGYNPCLPLMWNNWGYLTAWQPTRDFYAMYATTGTSAGVNQNPLTRISSSNWVHIAELGFIHEDSLGLGPGTYRLQFTLTEHEGRSGCGGAINFQQQLGRSSHLGFFTRCGYMDPDAAAITGVKAAATAGLVLQAPFRSSGWGSRSNAEQVYLGFLWQRPAATENPAKHHDEYGLELGTVLQLTPTFFLQPDLQYIFNPIHSTGRDGALVFQLQGVLKF